LMQPPSSHSFLAAFSPLIVYTAWTILTSLCSHTHLMMIYWSDNAPNLGYSLSWLLHPHVHIYDSTKICPCSHLAYWIGTDLSHLSHLKMLQITPPLWLSMLTSLCLCTQPCDDLSNLASPVLMYILSCW
jgi:hypothetical protein